MHKSFCPKCGLEYTQGQIKMRMGVCEECEPDKFKEQYETDINRVYKMGQQHITEHTFFPAKPKGPWFHWWRRENR